MQKYIDQPTVIDLFCGCGGLSQGFSQAGFNVLLGVDNNEPALKTLMHNHKDCQILKGDLSSEEVISDMQALIGDRKIDVIIGGPPCQGFSLTGLRNKNDDRNKLYLGVLRAVKHFRPQAFLIENVPGIANLYGGIAKKEIEASFDDAGYNVTFSVLYANEFGVPQIRKRAFFVGLKKDLGTFTFPTQTHNKDTFITCSDAISDLPSRESEFGEESDSYTSPPQTQYQRLIRGNNNVLYNHVATKHTDHVKNVISQVPEGGNHKDLPPGVGESRKFNEAWTRYHSQEPSRTIDTGHRNHFHYKYNRVPTIRENARLQSFPDSFIFLGTRTEQNRQVGNAVPPLLTMRIAEKLLEYLK